MTIASDAVPSADAEQRYLPGDPAGYRVAHIEEWGDLFEDSLHVLVAFVDGEQRTTTVTRASIEDGGPRYPILKLMQELRDGTRAGMLRATNVAEAYGAPRKWYISEV